MYVINLIKKYVINFVCSPISSVVLRFLSVMFGSLQSLIMLKCEILPEKDRGEGAPFDVKICRLM